MAQLADYWMTIGALGMSQGVAAAAISAVWGRSGVLMLGPALFFGAGAYASPLIGSSWLLSAALGAGASAAIATALGAPLLRMPKGLLAFAAVTMVFALIAERLAVSCYGLTNGSNGMLVTARPNPLPILLQDAAGRFIGIGILSILSLTVLMSLQRRLAGDLAVLSRDVPDFAVANGISIGVIRTVSAALAAAIIALAGAAYSSSSGIASPEQFGVGSSMRLMAIAVIGRMHPIGAFVSGVVLRLLEAELGTVASGYYMIIVAAILVAGALRLDGAPR